MNTMKKKEKDVSGLSTPVKEESFDWDFVLKRSYLTSTTTDIYTLISKKPPERRTLPFSFPNLLSTRLHCLVKGGWRLPQWKSSRDVEKPRVRRVVFLCHNSGVDSDVLIPYTERFQCINLFLEPTKLKIRSNKSGITRRRVYLGWHWSLPTNLFTQGLWSEHWRYHLYRLQMTREWLTVLISKDKKCRVFLIELVIKYVYSFDF